MSRLAPRDVAIAGISIAIGLSAGFVVAHLGFAGGIDWNLTAETTAHFATAAGVFASQQP